MTEHYSGANLTIKKGESWKKVFGPSFLYLNSNSAAKSNPFMLWNDAKKRVCIPSVSVYVSYFSFKIVKEKECYDLYLVLSLIY